jgi:hypothetical protein
LLRPGSGLRLRTALHHLYGGVAVAREDKEAAAIDPVHFSITARLFQPGEPPHSREFVPDILAAAILAGGRTGCQHDHANRNHAVHSASFRLPILKTTGKTLANAFPILPILCLILFGAQISCTQVEFRALRWRRTEFK